MSQLPYRQVHLDFHTSEAIKNIGIKFSRKQFQDMLKVGHVNSITVFAKCHHGWSYHPSKVNEMHPGLNFDLMGEMIEAAHEIGVRVPVYISAGLDEKLTRRHPEWVVRDSNESTTWTPDFMHDGYHELCFNTPYVDILLSQVEEVLRNYPVDSLCMDIFNVHKYCYCQNCIATLRKEGKDPRNRKAVIELTERANFQYMDRFIKLVDSIKPGLGYYHNSGHVKRGRRDILATHTHLEMESLATGGIGFDHYPLSARYVQPLGCDFVGMTGRFHTTWGEFGGYKHPNTLRYEAFFSLANGARVSVGDQLHPEGEMDFATYTLIGEVYKEVEKKEEWCTDVMAVTDIGLLSVEACGYTEDTGGQEGILNNFTVPKSDAGALRILNEGKFLYDVLDLESDFCKYKVIILPDRIKINEFLKLKLEAFFNAGGKVFASGESGISEAGDVFAINLGAKLLGENNYQPDYFKPNFKLKTFEKASFVCYSKGQRIELDTGSELGYREDPYFNRDIFTFCSHQHTPSSLNHAGPGMVESKNGIYFAWNVFEDYAQNGSLAQKEFVVYSLNRLLSEKTLQTSLGAQGIVTLMHQKGKSRFVNHLIYAPLVRRGMGVEVIEDVPQVQDIEVTVKIPYPVKKIYLAPQMAEIGFTQTGQFASYTVPKLNCHQMVVLEY